MLPSFTEFVAAKRVNYFWKWGRGGAALAARRPVSTVDPCAAVLVAFYRVFTEFFFNVLAFVR